jgi:DNA-binding transcriptional regulator YiaG
MADLVELEERIVAKAALPSAQERRMLRERAQLSRQEVADSLGCSQMAVAHWEEGATPRPPLLGRYVQALRLMRELN